MCLQALDTPALEQVGNIEKPDFILNPNKYFLKRSPSAEKFTRFPVLAESKCHFMLLFKSIEYYTINKINSTHILSQRLFGPLLVKFLMEKNQFCLFYNSAIIIPRQTQQQ
jgi:hypothetical protein